MINFKLAIRSFVVPTLHHSLSLSISHPAFEKAFPLRVSPFSHLFLSCFLRWFRVRVEGAQELMRSKLHSMLPSLHRNVSVVLVSSLLVILVCIGVLLSTKQGGEFLPSLISDFHKKYFLFFSFLPFPSFSFLSSPLPPPAQQSTMQAYV